MNFNFGEVLTRAWQITWKYKVLWIFGILAGCSEGGGGSGNSRVSGDGTTPLPQQYQYYVDAFSRWITENWWVVVLFIFIVFLLVLLAIFLGTIGRIGLIRGTLQAETGAQTMSFGPLFNGSLPYFWRVFGLAFLFGMAAFLVAFMIGAAIVVGGILTLGIGLLCFIPFVCILVPIMLFLNLILEQSYVAIVKDNLGIVDGWKRGWAVVRDNLGPVIVMALILFVLTFIAGLIIALPILLIFVPAVITFVVGNQQNMTPLLIAGAVSLLYLPVLIFLRGILATYKGSAWTLTYLRLTATPGPVEILPPPAEPPVEANA